MTDLASRFAALEQRVRMLEDQLEIYRLISSYGPAVDTGSSDMAAALWDDEGTYEFDTSRLEGPAGIAEMVRSDGHQALIRQGCAHILAMPVVRVDGDTARATGYSRVYRHTAEGYEVWRVSANHWELKRTTDGWKVVRRVNRTINGEPEAREILETAFGG